MDRYLRKWRQEALNKGQHEAAIYIGDKVLALTDDDTDAYWLAQVHFSNNNFTRALALLSRKDLTERSLSCQYLAAHCYIKQGIYDQALSLLGEDNPKHLIDDRAHNARRKLAHLNGNAARHITHRNGRLGPRDRIEYSEERERDREQEKDIQFQAAMCYLRGLCFAKRNAFERARDCYKDAVLIDIQCFEAFDQLMRNSLMSPAEELEFLDKLDFESIRTDDPSLTQEAAQLTKMLYMTRLSKYASPAALTEATETLSTHYNLASNPDLLLTRAATLYTQCRFHEALAITSSILNPQNTNPTDVSSSAAATASSLGHDPTLYPIHLACLYETSSHNTLFLLSHTLSQHAPNEPYTYLAIATYYLSTSRIAEARRFFSKASLMDPHSAPAWIGFAHTFAAEGEHDQAIAAYSTAARLFQGSHLPQLFLGMQHLALNNMQLAWEYCNAAYEMSSGSIRKVEDGNILAFDLNNDLARGDPLVLNELGVIFYHQADLPTAAKLFRQSIIIAEELDCVKTAWVATRANLAHALRRMGNLDESLMEFDECLRITTGGAAPGSSFEPGRGMGHGVGVEEGSGAGGSVSGYDERNLIGSIHTSRALVLMTMQRTQEAVISLHEAVRVLGGDASGGSVAGTLLGRAMELWALEDQDESGMVLGEIPEEQMNAHASVRRAGSKGKGAEDVNIQMREQMRVPRTRGKEVEDGLDQDADDMLNAALGTRS